MRNLLRLVFPICLLVPIAAHGQNDQKWLYMPSIGYGTFTRTTPISCYARLAACSEFPMSSMELTILNPGRKPGRRLKYLHRASLTPWLGYGFGIASSGRYHFVGISAGPDFYIPGFLHAKEHDIRRFKLDVRGQARAVVMPLKFLGLGGLLYVNPKGWGYSYGLMVRIGWE